MPQCSLFNLVTCVAVVGILSSQLVGCSNIKPDEPATPAAPPPVVAQGKNLQSKNVAKKAKPRLTLTKIVWEKSFESALAKSKSTNKPVMIDFYADWCTWCKELDRTTYTASSVIEESQNFISVKVDAEKRTDLAQRYQVSGLPAIIWTDSEGNKIDSFDGYAPAETFLEAMQNAYTKFQPFVAA